MSSFRGRGTQVAGAVRHIFWNERGLALPTAMLALMLLTTLLVAFTVLSKSEPGIAANQLRAEQARAMAEGGIERAIWALSSSSVNVSTAPYTGGTFVSVGTVGGFFMTVTNGTLSNERIIDAVGWAPSNAATGAAHKHLHLTVNQVKWIDPLAAMSVRGELEVKGHANVTAQADTSCGSKTGTFTTGSTATSGDATVYGADGNSTPNQSGDIYQGTSLASQKALFDQHAFTDDDLNMLKAMAKANGTYYQGKQKFDLNNNPLPVDMVFDASNPLPVGGGVVFVDTTSGNNLSCDDNDPTTCTNPSSDFITVKINGKGDEPPFNGWLIVNGSIDWKGNYPFHGLAYAQNDISLSGNVNITGAVVSRNIKDKSVTSIDSDISGNVQITYNCAWAKNGGGSVPTGWFLKPGTFREVSD